MVDILHQDLCSANSVFSVNIEVYLVPHAELLLAVKECTEEMGRVPIQNTCGVTVETFLRTADIVFKFHNN